MKDVRKSKHSKFGSQIPCYNVIFGDVSFPSQPSLVQVPRPFRASEVLWSLQLIVRSFPIDLVLSDHFLGACANSIIIPGPLSRKGLGTRLLSAKGWSLPYTVIMSVSVDQGQDSWSVIFVLDHLTLLHLDLSSTVLVKIKPHPQTACPLTAFWPAITCHDCSTFWPWLLYVYGSDHPLMHGGCGMHDTERKHNLAQGGVTPIPSALTLTTGVKIMVKRSKPKRRRSGPKIMHGSRSVSEGLK